MAKTRRVASTSTSEPSSSQKEQSELVRNSGQWTEARFRSFIASALRGAMRRWPPKWEALKRAFIGVRTNKKTGREAKHYRCSKCNELFTQSAVQVDHIKPISDWSDLNVVVDKLFCEVENLQVLCKPCHKKKTKEERENRKNSGN